MRRRILWGRVIGLGVVLTALVGGTYGYRILGKFRGKGDSIGDVLSGLKNPRSLFPDKDRITVLLIGQDYNHDNRGFMSSKNTRADTIMLLNVDLDKKQLRACSIPRDTYVEAPDGKTGKINATYMRGGAKLLKKSIQTLVDVPIDYYLIIKPDAVRNIVDAIGGVNVETLDEMNYDDNWGGLHVHLPAGPQKLDGKGAEGYVRFREVNRYKMSPDGQIIPLHNVKHSKEEGDLRRMARQQLMIQAMTKSANSPGNMLKADQIIETGFGQITTDLTRRQCLALGTLFKGTSRNAMVSGTLPGSDSMRNGVYFFALDKERSQSMVDWIIKGDESAAKRLIRISVKNGTKIQGVAKTIAGNLSDEGYQAQSMGNAPPATVTLVTFQKAAHEEVARKIQKEIGATSIQKSTTVSPGQPDIEVVIGEDIAKQIHPPKGQKPPKTHS